MIPAKLIEAAIAARRNAHAPYSGFAVGAAVECASGTIIPGCNVESSSFGLTVCAERVALASAIAQAERPIRALAVATTNGASPCGACRQIIWDLCGDIPVYLVNEAGAAEAVRSTELLPRPFDAQSLK